MRTTRATEPRTLEEKKCHLNWNATIKQIVMLMRHSEQWKIVFYFTNAAASTGIAEENVDLRSFTYALEVLYTAPLAGAPSVLY